MKINKFKAEVFAGINNRSYKFKDGLNILLGDNEAGKSTIINAIYSSLFTTAQLKLNRTEGIEFNDKFLPYPDGDYSEAELEFEIDNLKYKIYKKWSNNNYAVYLELPDGRRIENPAKIKEYKNNILPYPKSTYKNIVFSSQEDIKTTLERINSAESPELIDTITSFLRRAVMELNGISIDKFRNKLNSDLDNLLKKWDLKRNAVTNSARGVNDPYKQGTGKIYDSYIAKEKLRAKIKESKINEKKFKSLSSEIKTLKKEEKELLAEIEKMTEIESDINQRAAAEPKLKNIKNEAAKLTKIGKEWPKISAELKRIKEKQRKLKEKISLLTAEKERAKKLVRKKELLNKIKKIESLAAEIRNLKKQKANFLINKEQLKNLEKYKDKITENKAALKAARLKAKINFAAAEKIKITCGVEEEKTISAADNIEADGYLRIQTDHIDLEIESAEINFSALKEEYNLSKKKYNNLSSNLNVKNIAEAREKLEKFEEVKRKIKSKKEKKNDILAESNLQSLKEEFKELKKMKTARDLEKISLESENNKDQLSELKAEAKIRENEIKKWQQKYSSLDNLKNLIAEKETELKKIKKKLTELASLPEKYNRAEEFIKTLRNKRKEREILNNKLRDKLAKHKELENSLPEISTKKMELKLQELKDEFKELKEKAENLLEIKKVFAKNLNKIDENSFAPLVKSFINNLNFITAGKYDSAVIEKDFSIKIKNNNQQRELPAKLDLLSYGTYDAAALALRFAIFDHLFADYGGFIILDDCLVNLDPERRKNAIKLIKKYQKKYQIIYSSCDPARAEDFKANIIKV